MVRQALYGRPSGIAGEAARRIPTGPDINWISVDQPDQLPNPYVTLPPVHPAASPSTAGLGHRMFPRGRRERTSVNPKALLAAVAKSDVRDYWTNDFGRAKLTGGYSVIVTVESAQTLLESIRGQVPSGYVAFIGATHSIDDPTIKGAELVMAPGQDQFDIVRLAATDAVKE